MFCGEDRMRYLLILWRINDRVHCNDSTVALIVNNHLLTEKMLFFSLQEQVQNVFKRVSV